VKKGTHSVGVTRQYCGQVGKQENCRVAVSLSISTAALSLPIAWRLIYRRYGAKTRSGVRPQAYPGNLFSNQPEIALDQIRAAVDRELPTAPVLADAAYGNDTKFRDGITELGLIYAVGDRPPTYAAGCRFLIRTRL
jgi:SRSO17 transposase